MDGDVHGATKQPKEPSKLSYNYILISKGINCL